MKTTIYFFQYDTQNGMGVDLFTSETELAEAIHSTIESYSPGVAAEMQQYAFGSDEWGEAWSKFKDVQGDRCNYFNHGVQEIEIPVPPEVREALEASLEQVEAHTEDMTESDFEASPWKSLWHRLRITLKKL